MRHAILIHAHRLPEQFGRLCAALRHPDFDIYANIDAKSDIQPFRDAAPQVKFITNRINIKWGHWSQVEATLNSMRCIADSGNDYGYVIFISGQDYPVRPLDEIAEFLDMAGQEFIGTSSKSVTDKKEFRRLEKRYTKRWLFLCRKSPLSVFNKTLHFLPDKKHIFPFYKGSSWWNLTFDCVLYILNFVKTHPAIVRSYCRSLCPDEIFFQSLLHASPFKDRLVDRIFRYMDWSAGESGPRTLTVADFEAIISSDAWFARKVDIAKDAKLADMLDAHISAKAGTDQNTVRQSTIQ